MNYNEILLDESVLDIESWLPMEVLDEIAEVVFGVEKKGGSNFKLMKISNLMYKKTSNNKDVKIETAEYTGFESIIQSYSLLERVPA